MFNPFSFLFLSHRLEFKLDNSNLIHTKSGKCVRPVAKVEDGVALGLFSSCGGHQFSFTAGGSLQHVGSKKCVRTKSGVSDLLKDKNVFQSQVPEGHPLKRKLCDDILISFS